MFKFVIFIFLILQISIFAYLLILFVELIVTLDKMLTLILKTEENKKISEKALF